MSNNNKKEAVLYLVMGGLTTLVNIVAFYCLDEYTTIELAVSATIANILAIIFAYFSNKLWVFERIEKDTKGTVKEIFLFLGFRGVSLGIDVGLTVLMVSVFGIMALIAKIIANVVVVIVNYAASKWLIFK